MTKAASTKATSKSTSTKGVGAQAASKEGIPAGPTATAPRPPKGFTPPKGRAKGGAVTAQQQRDAADVAREVSTSPTYAADFTHRAPAPALLAGQLTVAGAWSAEERAALAWLRFVKARKTVAWELVLGSIKELKPEYELAVKHDPAIAERYPHTGGFLDAWRVAAVRGVTTRAANKRAAKAAGLAKTAEAPKSDEASATSAPDEPAKLGAA